jgi:hypothetical protein
VISDQQKSTEQFLQHSFAWLPRARANECSSALCNAGGALRESQKTAI